MNIADEALIIALEENKLLKQELFRLQARISMRDRLPSRSIPTLLETITDSINTFIVYLDKQEIIRFVNLEACSVLGRDRQELMGMHVRDALRPGEYERVKDYIRRALDGETVIYEIQSPNNSGDRRYFKCEHLPHFDNAGKVRGFVSIVHETTEYARTLNALALTEERFRILAANGPVLIFSLDTNGIVTFAEGRGLDILVPETKNFVGKNAAEVFPDQREILSQIELAMSGIPMIQEVVIGGRAIEVRSTPLMDGDGELVSIIGVATDISDRKQADDRVRRVSRLYSLLSKTNEAIVRIKDRQNLFNRVCSIAVEDGSFALSWIGMLDYQANRVLPVAVSGLDESFVHRFKINLDNPDENQGTVGTCFREKRHNICQNMLQDPRMMRWVDIAKNRDLRSCASFPLFIHNKIEGMISFYSSELSYFADEEVQLLQTLADNLSFAMETLHNESLREEAENALRESETKYRRIVETTNEGIWVVDQDANTIYVNRRMAEMLEYSVDEMIGKNLMTFVSPDFLMSAARNLSRRKEGISEQHNSKYRCKSGKDLWVFVTTNPLYNEESEYIGALAMITDITERKSLEEQLLQSQKMEGIGRLAGGIAHDFNNLLTVILGYASLASLDVEKDSMMYGYLEQIRRGGERAAALTNQLLSFARKQIIEPRVLRLDRLAQDMDKMLRRLIGEDIDLQTNMTGEIWNVLADPGQIEQVLVNLVVNARDAMPKGGKITIDIRNIDLTPHSAVTHPELPPGSYVNLSVNDTGEGMEPEVIERLFEPFFTTKKQGKGTGLGLATSYGIIRQSGGCLYVSSEPGQGSHFDIFLPRVDEFEGNEEDVFTGAPQLGFETILIVEDELLVREYVVRALRGNGYNVLEAASGEEAMKLVDMHRGPIDLLLTDVVMPNMNGQQLAEAMQKRLPDLRVLYASGYTDDSIIQKGILEKDIFFLQKPYTPEVLFKKVRDLLDV